MNFSNVKPWVTTGEQRTAIVGDYVSFRKSRPAIFLDGDLTPGDMADMQLSDVDPLTSIHLPEQLYPFLYILRASGIKRYAEIGTFSGGTLKLVTESCGPMDRVLAHDVHHLDWRIGSWFVGKDREHNMRYVQGHLVRDNAFDNDLMDEMMEIGPFDIVFVDGNYRGADVKTCLKVADQLSSSLALHDIRGDRDAMHAWETLKEEKHDEFNFMEFDAVGGERPSWKRCGIGLAFSKDQCSDLAVPFDVLRTIKEIIDP